MRSAASGSIRDIVQITVYSDSVSAVIRCSKSSKRCSTVRFPSIVCRQVLLPHYKQNFVRRGVTIDNSPVRYHEYFRPFLTNPRLFTNRSTSGSES